jgi:D-serine dehydratase
MNRQSSATISNSVTPDSLHKGLGPVEEDLDRAAIRARGWNLLREDLSLPTAVLYQDRLQHNLDWMQQFIDAYGVKLAPHGKTTMTPKLFAMQLERGAWGITLATAHQTLVAARHGVRRVLMANQLVGKENMAIVSRLLEDPGFEYYCLVDSAEQIDQLGSFFSKRGQTLHVLLEVGVAGGRTGIRDEEQLASVSAALSRWSASESPNSSQSTPGTIALDGVELFEGVLTEEAEIRAFLGRAVSVAARLLEEKRFQRKPFLLSGAGSAWYDVVAEVFSTAGFGESVEIVLRPGCYLTHDVGVYRAAQARISERNPVAHRMRSGLVPALQVWAYVQSIPEKEKAIVSMGKRDAAFDAGLPTPAVHFRPGDAAPKAVPAHWKLTKLMDQHAFMQIDAQDDLRIGDLLGFDISHPCLTFDKWRNLVVIDGEYNVVDVLPTYF